jgi:hypothetical protein
MRLIRGLSARRAGCALSFGMSLRSLAAVSFLPLAVTKAHRRFKVLFNTREGRAGALRRRRFIGPAFKVANRRFGRNAIGFGHVPAKVRLAAFVV